MNLNSKKPYDLKSWNKLWQTIRNRPDHKTFIPFVDKYKSTSLRQTTPGKANNLPLEIEFYLLSLPYSRSLSLKPTANKRIKRKLERLWLKLIVGSKVASRPTRARGFLSRTSLLKKLFTDPGKLSPSPRWSLLRDSPLTALLEGNKYRGRDIAVTAKQKARPFYYTASKHKTPYSAFYPGHVERDGETLDTQGVFDVQRSWDRILSIFNFDNLIILLFKFISSHVYVYLTKFDQERLDYITRSIIHGSELT